MPIALAVLLASCHRPDPAHITAADQLLATCDSLHAAVNGIDSAVYLRMDSIFRAQHDRIARQFRDTLDPASATTLGNYHRSMNGPLQQVLTGRPSLLADLAAARTRFADLHHDLSNGLLRGEEAITALRQEEGALLQLRLNAAVLHQAADLTDRAWDLYHAQADSLLAPPDTTLIVE